MTLNEKCTVVNVAVWTFRVVKGMSSDYENSFRAVRKQSLHTMRNGLKVKQKSRRFD